jgi:hypothetical protein
VSRRFAEALAALAVGLLAAAGQVAAWSCASDEPLTPQVSAEEGARISAEVARDRALAEALRCRAEMRADCPPLPTETATLAMVPASGS